MTRTTMRRSTLIRLGKVWIVTGGRLFGPILSYAYLGPGINRMEDVVAMLVAFLPLKTYTHGII